MGSIESIYNYLSGRGHSKNVMVIGSHKFTCFLAVQNCILYVRKNAKLVLKQGNSQEVKKVYAELDSSNSELI